MKLTGGFKKGSNVDRGGKWNGLKKTNHHFKKKG